MRVVHLKKRCRDISEAHADFLEDLLDDVSDATGQEINYVNAEDADIVIYSKGKWLSNTKKRRTYFDVNMGALAKWQLDDQTKKSMSQHVLYCFGLNDISELADYSGDESLMLPWIEGYEYNGLTPSDITALQSVW